RSPRRRRARAWRGHHLVPDPAAALHALLVHGLVRPAGAHLPGRFTALQLVRLLHLRDRPPAAARAC
ncbi:hypothetical protein ACWEM1_29235, partial [Streptomyces sp. NPDC004491]